MSKKKSVVCVGYLLSALSLSLIFMAIFLLNWDFPEDKVSGFIYMILLVPLFIISTTVAVIYTVILCKRGKCCTCTRRDDHDILADESIDQTHYDILSSIHDHNVYRPIVINC